MNDMGMGQGGAPGGQAVDPQDASNNKVMALLCYFGVFLAIPYFMARQSPFVKFHLNQGIIFLVMAIGLAIVNTIVGVVGGFLGTIGGLLAMVVGLVVMVIDLAFFVMGAMNAWTGKAKPLPVIGGLFTALK